MLLGNDLHYMHHQRSYNHGELIVRISNNNRGHIHILTLFEYLKYLMYY